MFNDLIGTMPNRDPAEEQARQIIERLGLSGQIPAFNASLPQTGGYGGPATPIPQMRPLGLGNMGGGLTPEQSNMVMGATANPEQQAYGMINRMLGSTQADAFANRDVNAARDMIARNPALGSSQEQRFMNAMAPAIKTNADYQLLKANSSVPSAAPTEYYGMGAGLIPNFDQLIGKRPGFNEESDNYVSQQTPQYSPPAPPQEIERAMRAYQDKAAQVRLPNEDLGFFGQLGLDAQRAMLQERFSKPVPAYGQAQSVTPTAMVNDAPRVDAGLGASEAARGGAWGGIQGNPFYMGERPAPGHQLGYTGSFMGSSRGWTDDSEGRAWDARANRNMEIQRFLGNQEVAKQANATDLLRTQLNIDQRREASMDRKEGKLWDVINKTPEGQRMGLLEKGMKEGIIPEDSGKSMMIDEVLKRSVTGNKTKEGVWNIPGFLARLQSEFNPATMDGSILIDKMRAAGITPDMIAKYRNDPSVGAFAQRLLGPDVPVSNMSPWIRSLQEMIYGDRGSNIAPQQQQQQPEVVDTDPQPRSRPSTMNLLQRLIY